MDTAGASVLGERAARRLRARGAAGASARPACLLRLAGLRWTFVHYATGEEELYDGVADPDELTNLATAPGYRAELDDLRARARAACNPTPPEFAWE